MKYRIETREAFFVLGQEIELMTAQKDNMMISTQFWQQFNQNLRSAKLSQQGNWLKYAFMERRNGKLYYFCAIPNNDKHALNFISKKIEAANYLIVEHIGTMNTIYQTYHKIYKELIPNLSYVPVNSQFLHFERYDERFHWNRKDSMIEIWVPIQAFKSADDEIMVNKKVENASATME